MSAKEISGLPAVLDHLRAAQDRLGEIEAMINVDEHLSRDAIVDAVHLAHTEIASLLWLSRWELQANIQEGHALIADLERQVAK